MWTSKGSIRKGSVVPLIQKANVHFRLRQNSASLLLLDAQNKGLIPTGGNFASIESVMTTDDLYDEHWILAYEANIRGWLPSVGQGDHVARDDCFRVLKNGGISFYDSTFSDMVRFEPPAGWGEAY